MCVQHPQQESIMAINSVTSAPTVSHYQTPPVQPKPRAQTAQPTAKPATTTATTANSTLAALQEEATEGISQTIQEARLGDAQAARLVASRGFTTNTNATPSLNVNAPQPKAQPTVNTSGQVIGRLINTTA